MSSSFAVFLHNVGIIPNTHRSAFQRMCQGTQSWDEANEGGILEEQLWQAASEGRISVDQISDHENTLAAIIGSGPLFTNFRAVAEGCPPTF